MRISRRAMTAGAAFFLAFATGHLMQSGPGYVTVLRGTAVPATPVTTADLGQAVITPLKAEPSATPGAAGPAGPLALPDLPGDAVPALAMQGSLATRLRAVDSKRAAAPSDEPVAVNGYGIACTPARLTLAAGADASLVATLAAPCAPDQAVTLRHGGLALSVTTDRQGRAQGILPALSPEAEVQAVLGDGQEIGARLAVPGLSGMRRVVLEPAEGDGARLLVDGVPVLSADGRLAVASLPAGSTATLDLSVEVTASNCGRPVSGRVIVAGPTPAATDYSIVMPGCDALGESVAMRLDLTAPLRLAGQ